MIMVIWQGSGGSLLADKGITMNTLVVYYSHSANNAALAMEVRRRLDCDIFRVEEVGKRTRFTIFLDKLFNRMPPIKDCPMALERYERFIIVAPVWASDVATPMKAFLVKYRSYINHFSFITVCGGIADQQEKIRGELAALVRQEPEKVSEIWITRLIPEEKKLDVRFMMNYKLGPVDFEKISGQIDEFVSSFDLVTR
jgi:hypothetical protein